LISFNIVTCPSTCPLLHGNVNPADTARKSRCTERAKRRNSSSLPRACSIHAPNREAFSAQTLPIVAAETLYAPNIAVAVVPNSFFNGGFAYTRTAIGALAITVSESKVVAGFVTIEVPVSAGSATFNTENDFYFTDLQAGPGAVSGGARFINGIARIPVKLPIRASDSKSFVRLGTITSNDPNANPTSGGVSGQPTTMSCNACRVFQQDLLPRPQGKPGTYESNAPMVVAQPKSFWQGVGDWFTWNNVFQGVQFAVGFLPVIGPGVDCAKAAYGLVANLESGSSECSATLDPRNHGVRSCENSSCATKKSVRDTERIPFHSLPSSTSHAAR
jgi:hypothetical protein